MKSPTTLALTIILTPILALAQIGSSQDELVKRYGPPIELNDLGCWFESPPFTIQAIIVGGKCEALNFQKFVANDIGEEVLTEFSETEVVAILKENLLQSTWLEDTEDLDPSNPENARRLSKETRTWRAENSSAIAQHHLVKKRVSIFAENFLQNNAENAKKERVQADAGKLKAFETINFLDSRETYDRKKKKTSDGRAFEPDYLIAGLGFELSAEFIDSPGIGDVLTAVQLDLHRADQFGAEHLLGDDSVSIERYQEKVKEIGEAKDSVLDDECRIFKDQEAMTNYAKDQSAPLIEMFDGVFNRTQRDDSAFEDEKANDLSAVGIAEWTDQDRVIWMYFRVRSKSHSYKPKVFAKEKSITLFTYDIILRITSPKTDGVAEEIRKENQKKAIGSF